MYEAEEIDPRIVTLIKKLKTKYKTVLLTNAHHEFIEPLLQSSGLDKLFDKVVISSKVGIIKPDPRIFQLTLDELGIRAQEVLFIDDQTRHIEAARTVGLQAIYYEDFQQMKRELEQLLANANH